MSLFQRLSKVDEICKDMVKGWIRVHEILLAITIPSTISSLIILYCQVDDIFDETPTEIQLSANKKCASNFTTNKKCHKFGVTCYGIECVSLYNDCNFNFRWDIRVNKLNIRLNPIFIGLSTSDDSNKGLEIMYSSDGPIVIYKNDDGCVYRSSAERFERNDLVSIRLDCKTKILIFRLNGMQQFVHYLKNPHKPFRLSITIPVQASVEIIKFVRNK